MSWLDQIEGNKKHSIVNDQTNDIFNHQRDQWVNHYKNRLISEADLEEIIALSAQERKETIERLVYQMIEEERVIIPQNDIEKIIAQIINESVGYGPLEALLKEDSITEIMVNGPSDVYLEKGGRLEKTDVEFKDNEHIHHIIDRIIAPLGRRIDESSPMVDARLPDGSRVNAVIPPISLDGPKISIRKFNKVPFTLEDLLSFGTFSETIGHFLQACVQARCNMLVSGGTGSGKTTLLNVLSQSIPPNERVITIEDMAELRFSYDNLVRLEARPPNMEGTGEVTIRDLVRNALRMRPDRIIVGEVRGTEALDMLQAMNTGHEGSLTTVHANSPKDALKRLEAMIIMSGLSLTSDVISGYFVGALDIIIQTERMTDGKRRIVSLAEINEEDGEVVIQDIFTFVREGVDDNGNVQGYFTPTGYIPKAYQRMKVMGIDFDKSLFERR